MDSYNHLFGLCFTVLTLKVSVTLTTGTKKIPGCCCQMMTHVGQLPGQRRRAPPPPREACRYSWSCCHMRVKGWRPGRYLRVVSHPAASSTTEQRETVIMIYGDVENLVNCSLNVWFLSKSACYFKTQNFDTVCSYKLYQRFLILFKHFYL